MLTSAALVIALATASPPLTAAASHSLRPKPCEVAHSPWQIAARTALAPHCIRLARGNVLLQSDPRAALKLAEALFESPLAPYAQVLAARAHLALGASGPAAEAFERAELRDPVSVSNPLVMHDRAVALALEGKSEAAAAQYRKLVAQWQLLPRRRQVPLLLEAAMAVMRLGPEHVHEANGYLDLISRVQDYRGTAAYFDAVLALARVRTGMAGGSADTDVEQLRALLESPRQSPVAPRLPNEERAALLAAACEPEDPQARTYWQRFANTVLARPWRKWLAERVGVEAEQK